MRTAAAVWLAACVACGDSTAPDLRDGGSLSGRIVFTSNRDGTFQPWSMRADGTDPQRLTPSTLDVSVPTPSPDGRTVLLSDGYRVLSMDVRSGRVRTLAEIANVVGMDWSNTAGLVAVAHIGVSGSRDLALLHPDNGTVVPLLITPWEETAPSWSPDGRFVAFSSNRDVPEGLQLYMIGRDGSGLRRLTTSPNDIDGQPDWAPDGDRIAFRRLSLSDFTERIGVVTPVGNDTAFVPNVLDLQGVRFSPDGERFVIDRHVGDGRDIWTLNSDGSALVQLTHSAGLNVNPRWVP